MGINPRARVERPLARANVASVQRWRCRDATRRSFDARPHCLPSVRDLTVAPSAAAGIVFAPKMNAMNDRPSSVSLPGVAPRWIGLAAGLLVAVLDVVGARALGLAFELNGRAVTGWVWLYLAVSFGGLGFLVGWLLELRRRERAAAAEVLRQAEALDRARLEPRAERKAGGARTARRQHLARGAQPARDPRTTARTSRRTPEHRRRAPLVRVPARRDRSVGTGDRLDPRLRAPGGARPGRVRAGELFERVGLLQPLEMREKSLRLEVLDRVRRGRDRRRTPTCSVRRCSAW